MFDYHMHSTVSFDGHASALEMALAAKAAGLKEICFTDHIDREPWKEKDAFAFDPEDYARAYDNLRVEGLKIRRGVEYGLLPGFKEQMHRELSAGKYDFVIGSVHFVDQLDVYFTPYWGTRTQEQAELSYLEEVLKCVKEHDDFDVLGHLTYISKTRDNPTHRPVYYNMYREVVDEIMKILAQKGKGMEMNSSGVDRCGVFLPDETYFRRFKELGGEIVTMGSDAHTADRVGQYCLQGCQLLQSIFGYVCTFQGRKPIFHKI